MEEIEKDINRPKYFDPWEAVEYGIIDQVRDTGYKIQHLPQKTKTETKNQTRLVPDIVSPSPHRFWTAPVRRKSPTRCDESVSGGALRGVCGCRRTHEPHVRACVRASQP
jgi:hypothetical protein